MREYFDIDEIVSDLPPRYNIHPEVQIAVIIVNEKKSLVPMRWGLIPFWSKKPKMEYSTINARAETLETRPTFRHAFKSHRCIIPVDGFYEWKGPRGIKTPYYIHKKDNTPLAFAGLYDTWRSEDKTIQSATIVTTCANDLVIPIHDRMPVILTKEEQEVWLNNRVEDLDTIRGLMKTYHGNDLETHIVSTYVNNPDNEGPRCIERVPSLVDYFT